MGTGRDFTSATYDQQRPGSWGGRLPISPRLRVHAGALDGPLPPAYAAHAAALAAGDPGALDDAAVAFEAVGARLLAAEARAEAAACAPGPGASYERSALGRAAQAARRAVPAGQNPGACPGRARGGAHPARARGRRAGAPGLTNRAIADRLSLSVRTVEHHLQHAYHKLGVSDLRQLEGIVRPPPAPARVRRAGA
jgi:hypothetical protein